jgi:KDO2-lipid IV(A) lauroyltransferase
VNPLLSAILRVVLHCAGLAVTWLPRSAELFLGRLLGKLFFLLDFKRKKIGLENMRRCLPELGPAGWDALIRRNYEHYGVLTLELLHMFSPVPGHYPAYVRKITRMTGLEHWRKVHNRGKGTLFVTAHMANWEVMCAMGSMSGLPGLMITRRLKPQWLHDWMEARRQEAGIILAYQPRTLPAILKTLRSGGLVGFVMDQYHAPPMGTPVPFFGTVVDTLGAVGSLAQRTGAGVVLCSQVRGEDGLIRCEIEPYDLGDSAADPVEATTRLAREVERFIRNNPTQWLWVHRRFKNLPADAGAVGPNAP